MASLAVSFVIVLLIPAVILLLTTVVGVKFFKKTRPPARKLLPDLIVSVAITVAITLAISFVLNWTGVFQSHFYRPSAEDFGQARELGAEPEDVFFTSQDGTRLHGWFIPAAEQAVGTVLHFHGSDRNISFTIQNCHWLSQRRFNVFLFDYRSFGKSAGEPTREGIVQDAVAAIDFVRSRSDVDPERICLWGQSMGGQLAIVAAHLAGADGLRAIVAEATYASYSRHIADKTSQLGPLWLVQWAAWLTTSDAYAAERVVDKLAPTPLLLVHGTDDRGVAPYHSERLYARADEPKAIWRIEGGGHLDAFRSEPYRTRLVEYLTEACNATSN